MNNAVLLPADFTDRPLAEQVNTIMRVLGEHTISFYPRLVDLTHSVPTALLAGQLIYWTRINLTREGTNAGVWKTQAGWEHETFLTRRYIESSTATLINMKLLTVAKNMEFRAPHYLLNLNQLAAQLAELIGTIFEGFDPSRGDILLSLLGKQKAFNRAMARIAGDSIPGGLILSYFTGLARIWADRGHEPGWIENPVETIEREMRLNRNQQEHARRNLIKLGLIHECLTNRAPPRLRMRIVFHRIAERAIELGYGDESLWTISDNSCADDTVEHENCCELDTNSPRILKSAIHILKSANVDSPVFKAVDGVFQDTHYKNKIINTTTTSVSRIDSEGCETPGVVVSESESQNPLSLIFPVGLSQQVSQVLLQFLTNVAVEVAQDMLDELAWAMRQPRGVGNPIGYVRTMLVRFSNGQFTKENAFKVQAERERDAELLKQRRQREAEYQAEQARLNDPAYQASLAEARERVMVQVRKIRAKSC